MFQKKFFYLTAFTLYLATLLPVSLPLIPRDVIIPRAHSEDIVVATVNGEPIYKAELDKLLVKFRLRTENKEVTDEDKHKLLTNLTTIKLILQHPDGLSLRNDKTLSKMVEQYEEGLIVNRFILKYVNANAKISEDDLRLYYNTHKDQFSVSPELEARIILLKTREDAEKILEKLRAGEDFAKLAQAESIDLPTAKEGGSLGVVGRGDVFPKIWRTILKLKEGEISDIVETEFGYNILTVEKIVSPEVYKPFEEVRSEIRKSILPKKREKIYQEMVAKLESGAKIEIFEDRF